MGQIALKFGLKVTYLQLIALIRRVVEQYFINLGPKITYVNINLGHLKSSKVLVLSPVSKVNGIKDFQNSAKLL